MFQVSFIAWQADHLSKWTKIRNRLVSKSLTLSQETRDIIYRPQILHRNASTPQPHRRYVYIDASLMFNILCNIIYIEGSLTSIANQ